jgi:hypothetical protein|tara:strand:+ start:2067 stop:2390 length:324 start_codon:yes stop_codon:yes gene_type:complete
MEEKIPNNIEGEAIYIELVWDSVQDLIDLQNSEQFTNFILLKSYDAIAKAIENNSDKVELFNIFNMSLIIELEKKNYHLVLNTLIRYFESIEDYEECEKIKTLINKL